MAEDSQQRLHDEQITAVVHGFTQVWNRFEVMLGKELFQIQDRRNCSKFKIVSMGYNRGRNRTPFPITNSFTG